MGEANRRNVCLLIGLLGFTALNASGDGMARINIEECWWNDPRRSKLIRLLGDEDKADAQAVRMWRLAQEFWGRKRQLIPAEIFETLEANSKLIEAKLAEVRDGGVYVRGSSQYLDWHAERRAAASLGGKKSAEKRRTSKGSAQPVSKQTRSKRNQTQPSGSGSHSDSDSVLESDSENLPIATHSAPTMNPVKVYCDLWKSRNGRSPDIRGKEAGQISGLAKDVGIPRTIEIIKTYFSMPDPFFIKKGYDVSTMLSNLAAIQQFEANGKIITREFVKQVETQVDKIQNTKRRKSLEELESEYEEQKLLASGGEHDYQP